MKTDQENLTAKQSLDIITHMIQQAQGNAQKHSFQFLLWGWTVVVANLGMFTLIQLNYPMPYLVWAITIPVCGISIYAESRQRKEQHTFTHLDRVASWLWCAFGLCVFTIVFFGFKINFQTNPMILIVSTIPTLISGVMLRFRPLLVGGFLFWAFGIVGFLTPFEYQNLVGAVAILCGYIIPGYMLKRKQEA
jgi:hypothetical protein